jgi:hypothetical protein
MSKITDEEREKTRKEMMKEIDNCENSRDRNTTHYYISTRNKIKITEDIIKEFFIDKMNWWDDTLTLCDDFGCETTVHYYTSPCHRYVLTYDYESNICDENGDGWNLHIDNSDMNSIGNISVNYVEEVVQLIDIFKNY